MSQLNCILKARFLPALSGPFFQSAQILAPAVRTARTPVMRYFRKQSAKTANKGAEAAGDGFA